MARKLAGRRFSPGLFTVHLGLEGSWPGIPHSSVLMGPRFAGLFADVFDHGVLPQDFVLMLDHPSITDPSLAPPGKSVLRAAIPVANLRRLPIDWESHGTLIENRIIAEIGRRLVPDIHDRIVTRRHTSPRDAVLDRNVYGGSAWSLETGQLRFGRPRPANRDARIANLYLVGSGTSAGAGLPGVLASAKASARLILENHR
jgi:phytoene desaturase